MDAGKLDKIISITKTTSTSRSADGAPVITVSTLASNIWSEVLPTAGRERWANNALIYEADTEFILRYTSLVTEKCCITFNSNSYNIKKIIDWNEDHIELHVLGQLVR